MATSRAQGTGVLWVY